MLRDTKIILTSKICESLININVSYGIKPLYFNWSFYKEERPHDFKWKHKKSCKQLFNILKKPGCVSIDLLLYIIFFLLNTNDTKEKSSTQLQ